MNERAFGKNEGKTEPIGGFEEYSPTEPIAAGPGKTEPSEPGGGFADYSPTEAVSNAWSQPTYKPQGFGMNVPDFDRTPAGRLGVPEYDINAAHVTTPGVPGSANGFYNPGPTIYQEDGFNPTEPQPTNDTYGFQPVVGWLVCVDGPDRGRDYRIHDGYNSIGRAPNMDICITGDLRISREKHAVVAYDPDEKLYYFAPADGKNLVKLNGKTLMMAAEIKAYDTLTIGSSKLMFIPLCGESFSWAEET